MKPYRWPASKNDRLLNERGLTFEQVVVAIESGALLDVVGHPNPRRYPRQRVFVVAVEGYAYLVPFVEEDEYYFLKTIIPSRRATRLYLGKDDPDHETRRL
ncbi:MAG TPA: hypothetical protein PKA84_06750 [Rubrivivax sp.]|nr:hypothetical protein [Rhodoferax sp.]MCL4739979.1 hypothetical protein [Burkholderiaceae bacterium]MCP5289782.1 toxin [Burkholderiaceae bacterium]HMR69916.1 hypothetical protein [Rubrivivax sp.]